MKSIHLFSKLNIRNLFLIGFVFFILTGCTSVQKSNFRDMSSAYREVIEEYSNDNILLNIVRASNDMPMSFLDIPSVVGSGSINASSGVSTNIISAQPSSFTGFFSASKLTASGSSYAASTGMSVNNTFTFTQASLDNAQFMSTFLKKVPLDAINFAGPQRNLPKAAIYTLLIDSIEIRTVDNEEVGWWLNDPMDPEYASFQHVLSTLLISGLTSEMITTKTDLGPPVSTAQAIQSFSAWSDSIARDSSLSFEKRLENGKTYYQLVKTQVNSVFCLNKNSVSQTLGGKFSLTAYCKDSLKLASLPKSSDLNGMLDIILKQRNPQNKPLELRIGLRSIANVFDFLGNVLNAQMNDNKPFLVSIESTDYSAIRHYYSTKPLTVPLFKVYKNKNINDSICTIYYRGNSFSISDDNESYTKSVVEFMATLLTISKTAGSIPSSPAVLVR